MTDLKTAWQLFDKNGTGKITFNEIGYVMRSIGLTPSEKEIEEYGRPITDADNTVSWDNFQRLLLTFKPEDETLAVKQLEDALKVFDKDGNGLIPVSDLKSAMSTLGEGISYDQLDEIFSQMTVDDRGRISVPEFARALVAKK